MTITLTALQKQRRDTASNWTSNNTVLLAGEWGIETDTKRFKMGDGVTAWQSLAYVKIPDVNGALTGNLAVSGNLSAGGTFGVTGNATLSGDVVVAGDFTVNGTSTTVNTTNLDVEDKNITLGKVSTPSDTTADGGGITLKGATDKTFNWVDSTDSWTSSEHFSVSGQKEIRYYDSDSSHYVGFKAPATVTSNLVWTLPAADAAQNGYVLASDGSGNLSWVDAGSSNNPQITGDITLQNDGLIRGFSTLQATYTGSTKTLAVTVASKTAAHRYNGSGSNLGYKIDGYEAPFITLTAGRTYRFDQSDSSNNGHPLRFFLEANKTTAYTTGVTVAGTAGQAGAYTEISVTDTTPLVLHYQCNTVGHNYMGNSVCTNTNVVSIVNDSSPKLGGNLDTNGNSIAWGDAETASFGDNTDLQIYHSTDNIIKNAVTGKNLKILSANNNVSAVFEDNASVELYEAGSKKFETSSTGVSVTGALVATGDVTAFSDAKLKTEISTINNALSVVSKLRGVRYKWLKDNKPSIGLIAQEVEDVIPEIVHNNELEGENVKSLDYGKLVGVLIEAIKELKAEVDLLNNK